METKGVKNVVYLAAIILIVQITMLLWMLRPDTFFVWAGFAVIIILNIYIVKISLTLIKEIEEINNRKKK